MKLHIYYKTRENVAEKNPKPTTLAYNKQVCINYSHFSETEMVEARL